MKDFSGISPATLPPTDDPMFVPRVRSMLNDVDIYLREVSRGFGRIQQGEVPDGSGDSIGDTPSLDSVLANYLYLPGRVGGQTIRSADDASAILKIQPGTGHTANILEVYDPSGDLDVYVDSSGIIRSDTYRGAPTNSTVELSAHSGMPRFFLADAGDGRYEGGTGTNLGLRVLGGTDIFRLNFNAGGSSLTVNASYSTANDASELLTIRRSATHTENLLAFRTAAALLSRVKADGTWEGPISTTGAVTVTDSTFRIQDNADTTKLLAFELGGFTTATTRTLTPPNASTTIAGLAVAQTFTKAQTITPDSDARPLYILGTNVSSANLFQIDASGAVTAMTVDFAGVINFATAFTVWSGSIGATNSVLFDASAVTGPTAITIPTIDGTLVITAGTQTITGNKTFSGSCIHSGLAARAICSTSSSGFSFYDTTTSTKRLRFVLSGATGDNSFTVTSTAARNYGLQNLSGNIPVVGDDPPAVASGALGKVDLTGQGADITSTPLSNTPPAGLYQVDAYLVCTTAGTGAGTLALNLAWTDVLGATSENIINLFSISATGRTAASKTVQLSSGNIAYTVTATGGYGAAPAAAYAVYIRVTALG